MVSQLVKKRLLESIGKIVTIFLKENNFCYEGKVTGCDDFYVEIINSRTGRFKIIELEQIKDLEVRK